MKVNVDRIKCNGIGLCELAAPEMFELGDDSQVHVVGDPDSSERARIEDAISNCPTSALSLEG